MLMYWFYAGRWDAYPLHSIGSWMLKCPPEADADSFEAFRKGDGLTLVLFVEQKGGAWGRTRRIEADDLLRRFTAELALLSGPPGRLSDAMQRYEAAEAAWTSTVSKLPKWGPENFATAAGIAEVEAEELKYRPLVEEISAAADAWRMEILAEASRLKGADCIFRRMADEALGITPVMTYSESELADRGLRVGDQFTQGGNVYKLVQGEDRC